MGGIPINTLTARNEIAKTATIAEAMGTALGS